MPDSSSITGDVGSPRGVEELEKSLKGSPPVAAEHRPGEEIPIGHSRGRFEDNMLDEAKIEESPEGSKVINEEVEHQKEVVADAARKQGIDEDQIDLFRQFTAASAEWHDGMTKKLMRKVDLHLLPMLVLMYMLNFLDRK